MDEIGKRLKEERARLKLTQLKFAAIGGILANAQLKYEQGLRSPSALYLARLSEAGVDVLYVVTGKRSQKADETDFALLLNLLPTRERNMVTELIAYIARHQG